MSAALTKSSLFRWDRTRPQPESQAVGGWSTVQEAQVWTSGFIANRNSLPSTGAFDTDSDLVASLFERCGVDAVGMVAGTLSLVLWDAGQRQLLVACDRAGVKPMFYSVTPQQTLVSDRVGALLEDPTATRRLNIRSCVRFLHAMPPSGGETFFEGVLSVQPGGILRLSESEVVDEQAYWDLDPRPVLRLTSPPEYEAAYLELLSEVVPGYLPDGRFGVTLSGGLDSTSVAALARKVRPGEDMVAFTWVAPELPTADEQAVATVAADHLGIPLVPIRADLHWPLSSPEGLVTSPESPFLNFFSELWDETYRAMRNFGVDVALSGLDGDRLFGGDLFPYADLLLTGHWLELGKHLRQHLRHVTSSLPSLIRQTVFSPMARAYSPAFRVRQNPVPWLQPEFRGLLGEEPGPVWRGLPGRFLRYETLTDPFLGQVASTNTDHAWQHGIEFRHPLLDHRLIEFAARLPQTAVTHGFTQKAIVRRALGTLLPVEVTGQFDKVRPTAIGYRGLREREQDKVWQLMRDMRLSDLGLVDERALRGEYQAFLDGEGSTLFWYTITLEDWLRRYW